MVPRSIGQTSSAWKGPVLLTVLVVVVVAAGLTVASEDPAPPARVADDTIWNPKYPTPEEALEADPQEAVWEQYGADSFGWSLAASGDELVIGQEGGASVFARASLSEDGLGVGQESWVLMDSLKSPRLFGGDDAYGWDIARDGDRLAVSAPLAAPGFYASHGEAYIYDRTPAGEWVRQGAPLQSEPPVDDSMFGWSLALADDLLVVGAPYEDGDTFFEGAAYVFERGPNGWEQVDRLAPPPLSSGAFFGQAVAIEGDTIFVGAPAYTNDTAPGSVYVFDRGEQGGFAQIAVLSPSQDPSRMFGAAMTVDGDTLLVGSPASRILTRAIPGAGDCCSYRGAAYVYERGSQAWTLQEKLAPRSSVPLDEFGASVALAGDVALIGAESRAAVDRSAPPPRPVHLFEQTDDGWEEGAALLPARAVAGGTWGAFGQAVALSPDFAFVGSPDNVFEQAYVYNLG